MLTDKQKAMLDLAGEHFKYAGSLDTAAIERFRVTPTQYWQEINRLIQTEAAVAYSPATVAMLTSRRRRVKPASNRLGGSPG